MSLFQKISAIFTSPPKSAAVDEQGFLPDTKFRVVVVDFQDNIENIVNITIHVISPILN